MPLYYHQDLSVITTKLDQIIVILNNIYGSVYTGMDGSVLDQVAQCVGGLANIYSNTSSIDSKI